MRDFISESPTYVNSLTMRLKPGWQLPLGSFWAKRNSISTSATKSAKSGYTWLVPSFRARKLVFKTSTAS